VPSSYVHALECFVAAKQEYLVADGLSSKPESADLAAMYDYQRKYVTALLKQLPPGTVFPAVSRSILMHPPKTIKNLPAVQGPFLLQPAPRQLDGSDGGDATDVVHMTFSPSGSTDEDQKDETERLGVVLIAYQDGRVDVCLDVEKVEATWEIKRVSQQCTHVAQRTSILLSSPIEQEARFAHARCL
jgi:nucleoporin NUP82